MLRDHEQEATSKIYHFQVPADQLPVRLDSFLVQQLPDYSRTFLQKLITEQRVLVNNKAIKAGALLKPGDNVQVTITIQQENSVPHDPDYVAFLSTLPVRIVYNHEDFYIIDKPAGLIVHKTSSAHDQPTLVDWLLVHMHGLLHVGDPGRPGIVHRLDKDTSGLMIIPKNNFSHAYFGDLFKNRLIQKTYRAVVHRHTPEQGTIDIPIGRDPIKRNQMITYGINARSAITTYNVLRYFDTASYLEIHPLTGRTHQIRVHFKALGHPLLGDFVYGQKSTLIARHALHAFQLTFSFKGTAFTFESPLPHDFEQLLCQLAT